MAIVGRAIREKQASDAQYERELRGLKSNREMVEVPFEWHGAITAKAIKLPSYGWVPLAAIRCKHGIRKPPRDLAPGAVLSDHPSGHLIPRP
jgi:hypothetical protein